MLLSIWTVALMLSTQPMADDAAKSWHHPPFRLESEGKPIDHGAVWGHCGPTLADVDSDGKLDLVVGDFSGKFTWYRNVGTNTAPMYTAGRPILSDGQPAAVGVY